MVFAAVVALLVGLLMIGQWLFFLIAGEVPELQSAPVEIVFHLVAELLTALALIIAGAGLLKKRRWSPRLALVAFGMLLYTVIVSAGYFAQLAQWPLVIMFGVLLLLGLLSVSRLLASASF
jgi:hypothetical protein